MKPVGQWASFYLLVFGEGFPMFQAVDLITELLVYITGNNHWTYNNGLPSVHAGTVLLVQYCLLVHTSVRLTTKSVNVQYIDVNECLISNFSRSPCSVVRYKCIQTEEKQVD